MSACGVGIHSGKKCNLSLEPAPVNTGIVFRRVDKNHTEIKAVIDNIGPTQLSTTIKSGDISISTIEHLLSALNGLEIDNVYIDMDQAEVPIMDGSSAAWVFLCQCAGIKTQTQSRKAIKIKKKSLCAAR